MGYKLNLLEINAVMVTGVNFRPHLQLAKKRSSNFLPKKYFGIVAVRKKLAKLKLPQLIDRHRPAIGGNPGE
jgi:hypothetical protein